LTQIKDELAYVANTLPLEAHFDAILKVLPQEYAPVISVIENKFDTLSVAEVEVLLPTHESCTL